jgi:hypothetical protein
MKKALFLLLFIATASMTHGQDLGLSFSYFIPKNGYLSTPISPFSIRGIGFNVGNYLGFQTGASLYRMSGMSVKGLPFESKKPIIGPTFTLLIPVEAVIQVGTNSQEFSVKGGFFGFYSFDQKINYGNFDKAIRKYEGWDIANSTATIDNKIGFGFQFGAEYMVYVTKQIAVSLEGNYYIGGADLGMKGSYNGGQLGTVLPNTPTPFDFKDSEIDFTGLEVSLGFVYSTGRR